MKANINMLFGNIFIDVNIIPERLAAFAQDTLNRLVAANGGGDYTTLITPLQAALNDLRFELGDIDTGLAQQKGATLTLDQVIALFKKTMSDKKGAIADKVGGFDTPVFLEFYPHGSSEYTLAPKTEMAVLTHRVKTAATTHSVALGATLTALLQGFESSWQTSLDNQQQKMGSVDDNRTEREVAITEVQMALLLAIHTIALKFPANVGECSAFFNFSLLLRRAHTEMEVFTGTLAANAKTAVLNRSLTDDVKLKVVNTDDNAPLIVYLAATAGEEPDGVFVKVKPGKSRNLKPSSLGSLDNTFLMLLNDSAVNEGSYKVEVRE